MEVKIMKKEDEKYILQAAQLLVEGFKENWANAWPNLESALEEVKECLSKDRICRIAIDNKDNVVGWIGGINKNTKRYQLCFGTSQRKYISTIIKIYSQGLPDGIPIIWILFFEKG